MGRGQDIMSTTIVGLFCETDQAQNAYNQLRRANYEDTEAFVKGSYRETRFARELKEAGVPQPHVALYTQRLVSHGIILLTHTSDYLSRQAEIIMERNHSLDLERDSFGIGPPNLKVAPVEPGSLTTSLTYYGKTPPDDVTLHIPSPSCISPEMGIAFPSSAPTLEEQTQDIAQDSTTPCNEEAHFLLTLYEQLVAWRQEADCGHACVYTRLIERSGKAKSASRNKTLLIQPRSIQSEAASDELSRTRNQKFEIIELRREP